MRAIRPREIRTHFRLLLGALLASAVSCAGLWPPRRGGDVLLVTIDTLRADHVGYAGGPPRTPTLDSLAASGGRFEQAISAVPLTLPSHCTMMTGLWPHHHGVRVNEHYLGPERRTLAEAMKGAGYTTAAFVGAFPLAAPFGLSRGFDVYDDRFESESESRLPPDHRFRHERRAAEVVDATLAWFDRDKPGRSFVWVHFFDPHDPYEAPAGWREGYEGEIEYTDHELRRLLRELRARDREPELVVVASDHGEGLGEHDEPNHGLFIYDTTIRVPLLVSGKGVPRGVVISEQVTLADLFPTVAEFADVRVPDGLDGVSLAGVLRGEKAGERAKNAYVESLYAIGMGWSPLRGVRSLEWKYVDGPPPELYALPADPGETNDLGPSETRRAAILADALSQFRAGEVAPGGSASPEQMEKLRSLGYLSGGSATSSPSRVSPRTRAALALEISTANGLFTFGKNEEAHAAFTSIHQRDPGNPFVLLRLGHLERRMGRHPRSIERFRRAHALDPTSSEATYQMGESFLYSGRPDSAAVWFRRTLEIAPARVAALANVGVCAFQLGDFAQARDVLSRAAQQASDDGRIAGNLGLAELMLGNLAPARAQLLRSREILGDAFPFHYELGVVHLRQREVEPALREFASTQGPRRPDALIELAVAATARGQIPNAAEYLGEALTLGGETVRQRITGDRRLQAFLTTPEARTLGLGPR